MGHLFFMGCSFSICVMKETGESLYLLANLRKRESLLATKLSKFKQSQRTEPLDNKYEEPNEWRISRTRKRRN